MDQGKTEAKPTTEDHPLLKRLKDHDFQMESEESLDHFLSYVSDIGLELYPAQEEAILQIYAGDNVILNTPTGSGKSLVAAALHFHSLASGRRSFYTCPIKALVNEKFLALCKEFGPDQVGMVTGDASVNSEAPIICCTAEILMNMALRDGDRTPVDDVIMDEFHYYSDRDRGVAWQVPLLTLPHSRFLLMSATMGDTDFFEAALNKLTGRPTHIVKSGQRPVPLEFDYRETSLDKTVEDLLAAGKAPIYIVNFTQRESAQNAQAFLSINFCSKEEKNLINEEIKDTQFSSPYGKEIKKLLKHGVGIHHAGLLPKYRVLVERLAQKGMLKLICGTDTLGVGVNVPIRTVLFTKLCKFNGEKTTLLSIRDFHQISGRAGRKGFDSQGTVIAQAPLHVIENKKMELKAQLNPKAKKKMVKMKPPDKGYVHWSGETFEKMIESPPEKLNSSFQVSHAMLLNVLSRSEHGCKAMKQLIRGCHESDKSKVHLRKRAFQLFRSLVDRQIIEFIPKEEQQDTNIRVNVDLQDDFSLNQTLSLFLLDTLPFLDPMEEDYALKMLTLTESIIENPTLILHRQLDKIKREKVNELKAEGLDYDERMNILDELEYPKPHKEFIYQEFNQFSAKHPWVGQENIRPKSIAREMFETYQSFGEYIKGYGLERVEGLLLRYLSSVYKVLVQTVPFDLKNDEVDDMIAYFETIIKTTDSSLVDEWERLKDPTWTPMQLEENIQDDVVDITKNEKAFSVMIRNAVFHFLRALAYEQYERCLELIYIPESGKKWDEESLKAMVQTYFEDHERIIIDPRARSPKNTNIGSSEDGKSLLIELTLVDDKEYNDWQVKFNCDLELAKEHGKPLIELIGMEPIGK